MIASDIPPATAAAIESASSLGGQLMPPVMGIAAFLMAEFLGVDYFDVVARGWVPALIYYATVSTSVYLLAITFRTRVVITKFDALAWRDIVNLVAFVTTVGGLVALMAILFLAPMFAALYIFCIVGSRAAHDPRRRPGATRNGRSPNSSSRSAYFSTPTWTWSAIWRCCWRRCRS